MFQKRRWLAIFLALYGVFVFLPFLAPVLMKVNLLGAGKAIYFVYGFVCHQLPQRSLFFFGPKLMYSLNEIQAAGQNAENVLLLRQFIGTPEMGWKVAWSDRMISFYGGIWLFALLWGLFPNHAGSISKWGLLLLTLPMILDGSTHFLGDLKGLTQGFRYTNDWLAFLTGNRFPVSFYTGDALGSFNSWARWVTGLLFGFGIVRFTFPTLDEFFGVNTATVKGPQNESA